MQTDADSLLHLLAEARAARTGPERSFVLLNRTRDCLPYHSAVLATDNGLAHSGVTAIDPLGPYGQWLKKLAKSRNGAASGTFVKQDVPPELAREWDEWWPPHAIGIAGQNGATCLFCREAPWTPVELTWLSEWFALWQLTERAADAAAPRKIVDWRALLRACKRARPGTARSRITWVISAALLGLMFFPVHLTVRAPGEIVPREPTVLRATIDGMASRLHVEPNQIVQAGQLLAEMDDAASVSKLQVARQALATAEAEWRQTSQQALSDTRAKAQLAVALGRVEERRTEVAFLSQQAERNEVRAPHDGVVLIDDPGNWAGRTIAAGEPLLRLAKPDDQEVEAWLSVADAVELPAASPMRLFMASRPAEPVHARLRLYSFEAQPRPDGTLAYRLRGQLLGEQRERLGARGTVHVDGQRVPLIYWVMRRPLAALREATGW